MTIPYYLSLVGILVEAPLFIGIGITFLVLYALCWFFSKKHFGWMIFATVLYVLDLLFMIYLTFSLGESFGWIEMMFKAWILYYLLIGSYVGIKSRKNNHYKVIKESQHDTTNDIVDNTIESNTINDIIDNNIENTINEE